MDALYTIGENLVHTTARTYNNWTRKSAEDLSTSKTTKVAEDFIQIPANHDEKATQVRDQINQATLRLQKIRQEFQQGQKSYSRMQEDLKLFNNQITEQVGIDTNIDNLPAHLQNLNCAASSCYVELGAINENQKKLKKEEFQLKEQLNKLTLELEQVIDQSEKILEDMQRQIATDKVQLEQTKKLLENKQD